MAVCPVAWEDKSVWEWLHCVNTTKLHKCTLPVCTLPLRLVWASWLKPTDWLKSCVTVSVFSQRRDIIIIFVIIFVIIIVSAGWSPQRKRVFTVSVECFWRDVSAAWFLQPDDLSETSVLGRQQGRRRDLTAWSGMCMINVFFSINDKPRWKIRLH